MDTKRTYNYRIEPRDVDFSCHATLKALVDYLLHTAGEDADRNGFGVRDLNLNNASWVLTRLAVEIDRMPAEYEPIRITTWVSNVTRAMTTRNFDILDERGERIAGAVSNWAMIDLSTRRMLDLHQLPAYDSMTQEFPLPVALPRRLSSPEANETFHHTVAYSDLDFNGHANSTKYLQWVIDTLPLEWLQHRRFLRTDINFLLETRHGEQLTLQAERSDNEALYEIRNSRDEAVCRLAFRMG